MKTSRQLLCLAALGLGLCHAQAQPAGKANCDVKSTVANLQQARSLNTGFTLTGESCNALRNVLARLLGSSASAGKKLEPDKGLNLAAATKERQDALSNPQLAADLKALLADETDPLRRLVLEAMTHEEYGYYAARDLVLREARNLVGK